MTKEWGKGLRRTPHTLLPTKVCPNMYSCETNRQLYTKYIQRTTTRSYGPGQFRQSTSSCVLLRLTDLSGGGMPHLQRAVIRSTDNSVAMELQTCHLWWKCRGWACCERTHAHVAPVQVPWCTHGLTTCSSCPLSTFSGLSLPSLQLNSILRFVRYSCHVKTKHHGSYTHVCTNTHKSSLEI